MARLRLWLGMAALVLAGAWAPALAQSDAAPETLVIQVNSDVSIRQVYRELGYDFDVAASDARREELQQECSVRGSRRFGNIPRPIKFIGLAFSRDDSTRTLITVCHALRPYDEGMARELCAILDRPLLENRLFEFSLTCGARGALPKPPTDTAGRRLGDWP